MFVRFFEWFTDKLMAGSRKPWVRFTMYGISEDGEVKIVSAYNKAFIKNCAKHGLLGANDDETVQNFLLGTIMAPKDMFPDEMLEQVRSAEHPYLQDERNKLKRG